MSPAWPRARPGRWGALALVLLAFALAGCGVPVSQSAVTLPASDRVAAVGQPSPSTTAPSTTTPKPGKPSSQLSVFFFGPDGHLVEVRRPESGTLTPGFLLYLLSLGPNAKEKNLTNDVPANNSSVEMAPHDHGVATVYLDNASFGALVGQQLYSALGQIVYTLMTDYPDVTGIQFYLRVDGSTIPFNYTPNGNVAANAVTKQTYAALAPLPPPKTTKKAKTAKKG